MDLLEVIGIGAIVVTVFLVFKDYNLKKKDKKAKFEEKVGILVLRDPELKQILKDYLEKEKRSILWRNKEQEELEREECPPYPLKRYGMKKVIFGREYEVCYGTYPIEQKIVDKVKMLESDVAGKEYVRGIIEEVKAQYVEYRKPYQIRIYQAEIKLLKYGKALNSMFSKGKKLGKKSIVDNLVNDLNITYSDADLVFKDLRDGSDVLFLYPGEINKLEGRELTYCYEESRVQRQIARIYDGMSEYTLRYH
ncbi:hypothetical protein FEDK69T_08160 [Flavobacterium enshiense DK69]|nr:hypothetical protein [Flavobacterium enshiense]ESU24369.1 hypothetical protein FEDK69T_08160 [Flavobacterium enshiense DK69]